MWRLIALIGTLTMTMAFGTGADAAAKQKVPRIKVSSAQIAPRATIADERRGHVPLASSHDEHATVSIRLIHP